MKVVVYTAIFGTVREKLYPVERLPDDSVQYVCFSDRKDLACDGWEVRPPAFVHPTSTRRTARYHKLSPHLLFCQDKVRYDAWIWMDACLQITMRDPAYLYWSDSLTAVRTFKHPHRDCLYKEAEACKRFKKDDPAVLDRQVEYYKYRGWPVGSGLAETSCLVLQNTTAVCTLLDTWWCEVCQYSLRDQVSFPFAAALARVHWGHLVGCRDESPYFTFHRRAHHGDKR